MDFKFQYLLFVRCRGERVGILLTDYILSKLFSSSSILLLIIYIYIYILLLLKNLPRAFRTPYSVRDVLKFPKNHIRFFRRFEKEPVFFVRRRGESCVSRCSGSTLSWALSTFVDMLRRSEAIYIKF